TSSVCSSKIVAGVLMKKWLLSLCALTALFVAALYAQDVVGIWQGAVQIQGRELRMQFKVTGDGGLKALMYSLDQGAGGIPANVTVQAGSVKFEMPGIGGSYEGKLSADGTTLDGKMSQIGAPTLPLILKKVNAEMAWTAPAPP